MNDLPLVLLLAGAIGLLIALAEAARAYGQIPVRQTRQAVHLVVGVIAAFAPFFLASRTPALVLAAIAVVAMGAALRFGGLPAVHAARPGSLGTALFPLAAGLLYLFFWARVPLVSLPLLVLAFADTAGALVGEGLVRSLPLDTFPGGRTGNGSFAVFVTTGLVVSLGWQAFQLGGTAEALLVGLLVAPVVVAAELLADRGVDNLTMPLAAAFTLYLVMVRRLPLDWLLAAEGLALVVAYAAFRWRALHGDGAAGTFLLAAWLLGGGGWTWALPMVVFFVLSSILSRLRERGRPLTVMLTGKGSRRDLAQVAANGGIGLLLFLLWVSGAAGPWVWAGYLSAVSAATADTWGTEIGTGLRGGARMITTGRRVPAGTSGAVSLTGTLGAAAGALCIGLVGWGVQAGPEGGMQAGIAASAGGFVGSLADSLAGATIQARYHCPVCGEVVEKAAHCGRSDLPRTGGWPGVGNDAVNVLAGLAGTGAGILVWTVLAGTRT